MNIVLIGYRGTGKSVISRILADTLHCRRYSIDEEIVRTAGKSISEIIKQDEFNFLQKVDFYGHTPAVFRKHCSTVLFFRNEACFLFDRNISLLNSFELNSPL